MGKSSKNAMKVETSFQGFPHYTRGDAGGLHFDFVFAAECEQEDRDSSMPRASSL